VPVVNSVGLTYAARPETNASLLAHDVPRVLVDHQGSISYDYLTLGHWPAMTAG